MTMVYREFVNALVISRTALPYGHIPFARSKQPDDEVTEADWRAWQWNPPQEGLYSQPDNSADAKPTWNMLVVWSTQANRDAAIARLDTECATRITAGYGEQTTHAEWQFRFRASEAGASDADRQRVAAGHAERDRLRARFQEVKTYIDGLTDISKIEQLDFTDPTYWAPTWSPPDPAG